MTPRERLPRPAAKADPGRLRGRAAGIVTVLASGLFQTSAPFGTALLLAITTAVTQATVHPGTAQGVLRGYHAGLVVPPAASAAVLALNGLRGFPQMIVYGSSKFGGVSTTLTVASEFAAERNRLTQSPPAPSTPRCSTRSRRPSPAAGWARNRR